MNRVFRCPECGRVASIARWVKRPICLHSWNSNGVPEVWDGDDVEGRIEDAPNHELRTPGPKTWTETEPADEARLFRLVAALRALDADYHESYVETGEHLDYCPGCLARAALAVEESLVELSPEETAWLVAKYRRASGIPSPIKEMNQSDVCSQSEPC